MQTDSKTIKRIVILGKNGLTAGAISGMTGVSVRTAIRYLRAAGVSVRGRGRPAKTKSKSYSAIYGLGYRAGLRAGAESVGLALKTGT